jgi:hypothetical protein
VFERYTEHARRSIFFARYEASMFGSMEITSEELLLGIFREDKAVAMRVGIGAVESIRKELERLAPPKEKISTSVDLPLSPQAKQALRFAAEEADALGHGRIDARHLLLGLMRLEDSLAAKLLRKHGMELTQFREIARQALPENPVLERAVNFERPQPASVAPSETSLDPTISALRQLVDNTTARLREYSGAYGDQRLKRKPWTRKEALGHLIDWAIAHQQWVTRALMESNVKADGYPDEAAVAVQHYADFSWLEAVDLWASLNRLLILVLLRVPENKLDVTCRIGILEPVPLSKLIEAYLAHCEDTVGQVLARLD